VATRPSELFAVSAAVLLMLSFLSRFPAKQALFSVTVRNTGYGFPPSAVFLVMASVLCFAAAVYAIWPLQMNMKAGIWHYWVTVVGIATFWMCFYSFPLNESGSNTSYRLAMLLGQLMSLGVILLAQAIFVANLLFAVVRLRNISAHS
jgi:hypothetical protein